MNFLWEFVCWGKGWGHRKTCSEKVNFGQKSFITKIFLQNALSSNYYKPNKNQWIKNYTVLSVNWWDQVKVSSTWLTSELCLAIYLRKVNLLQTQKVQCKCLHAQQSCKNFTYLICTAVFSSIFWYISTG